MKQKHKFLLTGLSIGGSLTCRTVTEGIFWPPNNLTQEEFESLWEHFKYNDFNTNTRVAVTCDGLYEDGTPINGVVESLNDIHL